MKTSFVNAGLTKVRGAICELGIDMPPVVLELGLMMGKRLCRLCMADRTEYKSDVASHVVT